MVDENEVFNQLVLGVSWSAPVTGANTVGNALVAEPHLSPLINLLLAGNARLSDAEGDDLGQIGVEGIAIDGGRAIGVVGPEGWLDDANGRALSVKAVDETSILITTLDQAPLPTEPQIAAVQAGYGTVAEDHAARGLLSDDDGETVRYALAEALALAMLNVDGDAFSGDAVPPLDALFEAAGFEIHERHFVGAAGTNWDVLESSQQLRRLKLQHGFDDNQADMFVMLSGAGKSVVDEGSSGLGATDEEQGNAVVLLTSILDDPTVAFAVWESWAEDGLAATDLDPFVAEFDALFEGAPIPGALWLRARHAMAVGNVPEAVELYEIAKSADLDHVGLLIDRAALAADQGDAAEAHRLLQSAGVDTDDSEQQRDRLTALMSYGIQLSVEVEAFATSRPKASVGRNDACPCGSGKKYKQCHLGNEPHPLEARAGWLYEKGMRFLEQTHPELTDSIIEMVLGGEDPHGLADNLAESFFPTDLAFSEAGVFADFLDRREALLPTDEFELGTSWLEARRGVFEVVKATGSAIEVIDLSTRDRLTIDGAATPDQLPAGSILCGRPLPVGDGLRTLGGMLPVAPELVSSMLAAFETRQLDLTATALGAIFDLD